MATPEELEQQFEETVTLMREVLTGDQETVVTLPGGGTVRSLQKIDKDAADALASTIANFGNNKVDKTSINASGGVVGLQGYKAVIYNATATFAHLIASTATAIRNINLPDKDGTLALVTDITDRIGAANGIAPLDANSLISPMYLPSYVDDVVEFDTKALMTATVGEKGKIYLVDADESDSGRTNQYRWGGSSFIKIVTSPGSTDAVAEGTVNLYFTPARVIATVLSGFSTASSAVVTAADTIVGAIGKLQAQHSALAAANTGTNTGDETQAGLLTKLGATALTGSNTGDETAATIKTKLGIATLSGSNTGDETANSIKTKLGVAGVVDTASVGVANGVTPLDSTGKVASTYLPSYVDDVVEYATKAAMTAVTPGETGKIYVVIADESNGGKTWQYRWSGSAYTAIVSSPGTTDALVEGATNLYFTVARVLATTLTGLSTGTATLPTASDTVLSAIGKLTALWGTKDATGGFVGLTGFSINFKNAAGTITSTLANAATAVRTYTFPDKNITVAGLADILPTVATGFVTSDSSKAVATDTILAILGKLQAQINLIPYDFSFAAFGKPAASATVARFVVGRATTLPINLTGSKVSAGTATTAAATFTIYKNGGSIGTINIAAGASTATFTFASAQNLAVGDVITVVAPGTQDSTLADVAVTLLATLT